MTRRVRRSLIAAFVLIATALAAWLLWFSPIFSVQEVQVVGADGEAASALARAADVPLGAPLANLDAEAITARIAQLAWVGQIEVRRGWPDVVVLAVTERTGIARRDAQLVDAEGVAFTPIGRIPSGLPTVRGSDAGLPSAMAVYTSLPADLAERVVRITAKTRDDVTLTLRSGVLVRWGSAEQAELKAVVLDTLMNRKARIYDVSAPELPTTFGARG